MLASGFRWWHAAGIFVAANVVSVLPAGFNGDGAFYNASESPSVSPPDWLFPPVWFVLNVTSLVALQRVANAPPGRARGAFVASEAVGWALFALFPGLFFGLRSPVLGAADTALGLAVAGVSVAAAWRVDRVSAGLVALRLAWLALATYVSAAIAARNADPFLAGL